jgi:hypothetical protein
LVVATDEAAELRHGGGIVKSVGGNHHRPRDQLVDSGLVIVAPYRPGVGWQARLGLAVDNPP